MPHDWIADTLLDMASYAKLNGLHRLNIELRAAMSTARQLGAPGKESGRGQIAKVSQFESLLPANVVRLSDYRVPNS